MTNKEQLEEIRSMAQMLGNSELLTALEDGRCFKWLPREDITPYELALCMFLVPLLITQAEFTLHARVYDSLPKEAQRHFGVTSIESEL